MTEKKALIESTFVDNLQKMKPQSIFGLFQDIATADAEKIGYGRDVTTNAGKLWVFTRVYCVIDEYPTYLNESLVKTYAKARKAFAFPRYMEMTSPTGKKQVRISSVWALIDKATRKLIFKPELPDVEPFEIEGELPLPGKIENQPTHFLYRKTIRHSDIDLNGHLNNTRYIEMIVDCHDSSFYKQKEIASLLIHFESEINEGETIELYISDDGAYINGRTSDRICFEANLTYR